MLFNKLSQPSYFLKLCWNSSPWISVTHKTIYLLSLLMFRFLFLAFLKSDFPPIILLLFSCLLSASFLFTFYLWETTPYNPPPQLFFSQMYCSFIFTNYFVSSNNLFYASVDLPFFIPMLNPHSGGPTNMIHSLPRSKPRSQKGSGNCSLLGGVYLILKIQSKGKVPSRAALLY